MAEVKKELLLNNSEKFRDGEQTRKQPIAKAHKQTSLEKGTTLLTESAQEVGSYLLYDVLVPALKETLATLVTNGINMALFGDAKHSNVTRYGSTSRVDYNRYYNGPVERAGAERNVRSRASRRFDDIIFEARSDAEDVLDGMMDQLEDYGYVSVADFLDMSDITPEYTDYDYGWTQLGSARIVQLRRGYCIKLPRVTRLPRN